jgi:hypothetical protein
MQQGQVFQLKRRSLDGEPRWAYRYRAGGRDSRRSSEAASPASKTRSTLSSASSTGSSRCPRTRRRRGRGRRRPRRDRGGRLGARRLRDVPPRRRRVHGCRAAEEQGASLSGVARGCACLPTAAAPNPTPAEVVCVPPFLGWRSASQRTVISAIIPCATCGGPPLRSLTKHSRAYLPGVSRASSVICFVPPAILAV